MSILIKRYAKLEGHAKAEKLFKAAARAWIYGNSSGSNATMAAAEDRIDQLHVKAMEELVAIHGCDLEVGFPGLNPIFRIDGREFYTVDELATWAPRAGQA